MKSLKVNFKKILEVIHNFGLNISKMIPSKDGTKILVRENIRIIYPFAKIYVKDGKAEVVECRVEMSQVENYKEMRDARRFLEKNRYNLHTESFWDAEIYDDYPYSEVGFDKTGKYLLVNVEISRAMNIAQVYRTGNYLNVEENFEVFYEMITHKKKEEAERCRKMLDKLRQLLEQKFVANFFERIFGINRRNKPFSRLWLEESIEL